MSRVRPLLFAILCTLAASFAATAAEPPKFWWELPGSRDKVRTMRAELEGGSLVAHNGDFLGRITRDDQHPDSLFNPKGKYGSRESRHSIWSPKCKIADPHHPLSPHNPRTKTPPKIISRHGEFIAYMTVNPDLKPALASQYVFHIMKLKLSAVRE